MSQMPPPQGPAGFPPAPDPGRYTYGEWAASPHGAVRAYRSARGLAVAIVVLMAVMGAITLLRVAAHSSRASLLQDARDGSMSLFELLAEVDDADSLVAGAIVLWFLGALATLVVFIIWQYRHTVNAEVLRGGRDGLGPGWAIGGWFIPLGNFVLPCIQIFGASRPSDPNLPPPHHQSMSRGRGSGLVVWWAVVFGLAAVVDRVGGVLFPSSSELELDSALRDAVAADRLMMIGSLIYGVAAVLAAVMVWQLTNRQDRRAAALAATGGGQPGMMPGPAWGPPPPPAPPPPPPRAPGPAAYPTDPTAPAPDPTLQQPPGPWTPPGQPR